MKTLSLLLTTHARLAWGLILAVTVVASYAGITFESRTQIDLRLAFLQEDALRSAAEISSEFLNNDAMGAAALLGLVDANVKSDASGIVAANSPEMMHSFGAVGKMFDAEAVFVANKAGMLTTTWQSYGGTSTGDNIGFRPYFQKAMSGQNSFYPAISSGGQRGIYYAAPVYKTQSTDSDIIGAVVIRIGIHRLDQIVKAHGDLAYLISPQGVVFSSSESEMIGRISGKLSEADKATLTRQRQFGNLFDGKEPAQLPISVVPGLQRFNGKEYLTTAASVPWKDPMGNWTFVLLKEKGQTDDIAKQFFVGAVAGAISFIFLSVCFNLLRNGRAKELVDRELRLFAEQQSIISERKTRVTDGALAMSRARDQRELAGLFLSECHKLIGVTHGVIYVADKYDSNCLRFAAGFGCGSDVAQEINIGEGLLGQGAIDRKVLIFDVGSISSGEASDTERLMIDWKIGSSLGSSLPRSVIIAPILAYDDLVGVIEISSINRLEKSDVELFQDLLPFLATGLLLKSATATAVA